MEKNILKESYMLSNGVKIPKLGFGTWMIDNDIAPEVVRKAIDSGYRHIDTAQGYDNERGVGEGIGTCGLRREELFVTTKLDAAIKDYDGTQSAIEHSLEQLGLDYIDLFIIHAPQPWQHFRESDHYFEGNIAVWCAMEKAYKAGKLRAIGVSNFEEEDIKNLLANCEVRPMVNQILAHVSNTPIRLIEWCKEHDILVEAYSPLGHGEMMKNDTVKAMAERLGVSIPQLCIRYCLQLGLLPLPKSAKPEHIRANTQVDFDIPEEDMAALMSIAPIKNYGESSLFPVYGGKLDDAGNYIPRDFHNK